MAYSFTTETGPFYLVKDGTIRRETGRKPVEVYGPVSHMTADFLEGKPVPLRSIDLLVGQDAKIVLGNGRRLTTSRVVGKA